MRGSYVLPRAVRPLTDETLPSLVTRNARDYGFADPMLVLKPLGLGLEKLNVLAHARPPDGLDTLLGLEADVIQRLSSWHETAGMARVGGREIRRGFLDIGLKRSCPACLEESLHHRAIWDVAAITSCPRHGGLLVVACPGCGRPPRWRGSRLEWCGNADCTFDLRRDLLTDRDEAPAHVEGLHALYDEGLDAMLPGFNLDFGMAVEVTFIMGSHVRRTGLMGKVSAFLRKDPAATSDLMESGWNVLTNWPRSFDGMLDGLRGRAKDRGGRYGLRREFGGFAKWLSTHVGEPWALPFQEAFGAYLARQSDLRTTSAGLRRFGSPERLRHLHMTLTEAAKFLSVAPQTMVELADREDLYLIQRSGAGAPSLLRADRVHALKDRQEATLLRGEAAGMLGVGVTVLRRMLAAGLLSTVGKEKRVTQQRVLVRSEVEDFVRRAYGRLQEAPPRGKLVPLVYAMAGRRDMLDVLRAVMEGRLRPRAVRSGQPGLRGLLFDSLEVEEIVSPGQTTFSLVDAAAKLGMDIESVREWARDGYLPTVRLTSRHERGDRVTEQGLRQFRTDFVTSIEVGRLASTSGRWAVERLRFLGQPPLPSASVTRLYRRAEITADMVARVRPPESHGRAAAVEEANVLVDRVGADVARRLDLELRRAWSGFSDQTGKIYLQVIVGRRQRSCSKYVFRFNPGMRTRLSAAGGGWLALALTGFDSYMLVPWDHAEPIVGNTMEERHWLRIGVDANGKVSEPELEAMQQWMRRPPGGKR